MNRETFIKVLKMLGDLDSGGTWKIIFPGITVFVYVMGEGKASYCVFDENSRTFSSNNNMSFESVINVLEHKHNEAWARLDKLEEERKKKRGE